MNVALWTLGYVFVLVTFLRALLALGWGEEAAFMAGLLWPLSLVVGALVGVGWLCWHTLDLPAYAIKRLAEQRTLRQAKREQRLREAEAILREEGLDFNP